MTINSQPAVNACKSINAKYGWGPDNGYVYQKAYVELFIPAGMIEKLVDHLDKYPDITYQAINMKNEEKKNVADDDVNAVTWGVFRGKEII